MLVALLRPSRVVQTSAHAPLASVPILPARRSRYWLGTGLGDSSSSRRCRSSSRSIRFHPAAAHGCRRKVHPLALLQHGTVFMRNACPERRRPKLEHLQPQGLQIETTATRLSLNQHRNQTPANTTTSSSCYTSLNPSQRTRFVLQPSEPAAPSLRHPPNYPNIAPSFTKMASGSSLPTV